MTDEQQHASPATPSARGTSKRPAALAAAPCRRAGAIFCVVAILLSGCAAHEQQAKATERLAKARALFAEHCKTAGEKIYRTVNNVEGLYLIRVRPKGGNVEAQYSLDDPYGHDFGGDAYIESFLRGFFSEGSTLSGDASRHRGYLWVEAIDAKDGKRYVYTGRLEEPWQTNKHYLKGYVRFVSDKAPTSGPPPRYGVSYDDISTHEDREYWIAGSSLKVIDLQTHQVIAERVGYMMDPRQGDTSGGRAPWLLAANNACPPFGEHHAWTNQLGQTEEFVEKVLRPINGNQQ